jgi:hypothetical protein
MAGGHDALVSKVPTVGFQNQRLQRFGWRFRSGKIVQQIFFNLLGVISWRAFSNQQPLVSLATFQSLPVLPGQFSLKKKWNVNRRINIDLSLTNH